MLRPARSCHCDLKQGMAIQDVVDQPKDLVLARTGVCGLTDNVSNACRTRR
jgi:hypothetical protein